MYLELGLAVSVMTVLTLLAYKMGEHFWVRRSQADARFFLTVVSVAFLFAWGFWGRLSWAERFPVSSAIYWANLTPLLLSFAAGLAGHAVGIRTAVRPWISASLMCLAVGYLLTPMARPVLFPLELAKSTQWKGNVCVQTHEASCAAAAAVTLLSQHGIESSESDLAEACLTSAMGTEPLGLYRGLSSTASRHGHRALVAAKNPDDWIRMGQLPNAALVRFSKWNGDGNSIAFLGRQSEGHVIVVLGQTDGGRWIIGDPAIGRITWSDAELHDRFTGDAIHLVASTGSTIDR